jgi:hypothetical protein
MSEETTPKYVMFKLAAGSPFIIAEVLTEDDDHFKARFPLIFSFQDAGFEDGSIFVNASKFMHFVEGDVVAFNKCNLYAVASPKQNLIDYYVNWRESAPAGLFDENEKMMLDSAFDPNFVGDSLSDFSAEMDLEKVDPASKTIH